MFSNRHFTNDDGAPFPAVDGNLLRAPALNSQVTLGDMAGVFEDEAARAALPPTAMVYATQVFRPVPDGTEGGLFYGTTMLMPGLVGAEYFMTRGHFHAKRDRAEFYFCVRGEGLLLLMDEDRHWRVERMHPGSVHHIPGRTAHRTVNTGQEVLTFSACWPSDAGHDYATIARDGFSARVFRVDGTPEAIEVIEVTGVTG